MKTLPITVSALVLTFCGAFTSCLAAQPQGAELNPNRVVDASGLHSNGIALNGIALNGSRWNGIALNGISMNGRVFNGIVINGIVINGIVINGIVINGTGARQSPLSGIAVDQVRVRLARR